MVKVTALYNLPPGSNHEEFLEWRKTTHQQFTMAIPGLIKADFYAIRSAWQLDSPPFQYITEAYFPDQATFERAFFDPNYQSALQKSLQRIADPVFLISEEVLSEVAPLLVSAPSENTMSAHSSTRELVPMDLRPVPLQQDEQTRQSMYALAQRFRRAWEGWHGPFRLPDREEFLAVNTPDFVLAYNSSVYISGVDDYMTLSRATLGTNIAVGMSVVVLEVAENTAWIHDVHSWVMPDGYRFESGRYGRLYRRPGEDRICRWEVLQTNPFAAQEFFDTRFMPAMTEHGHT